MAARAALQRIPYASWAGVDNAVDVEGILRAFEYGHFNTAALFCDQMLRDDRINGTLDTRAGALLSTPISFKPADESPEALEVATILGGPDLNGTGGAWEEMFPAETMDEMLRWGHMMAFAYAEQIWKGRKDTRYPSGFAQVPRLRVWHPQFVYWNWGTFSFWAITAGGVIELPKIDENPAGDGQWFMWCPRGFTYGWIRALMRPLARLFIMRGWNYRDWARYNEVYGSPMKKGTVPATADDDVKRAFRAELGNAGAESVILVPKGKKDMGNDWDVEMVEAKSRGYTTFDDFKKQLDVDIAILVQGQNLTTEATGGGLGGGKAAEVHEGIADDKHAQDARIFKVARKQLLEPWTVANFGKAELTPLISVGAETENDSDEEAKSMQLLGEALKALKEAEAPIDVRTIVEAAGIPVISEEEEAAEQEAKAQALADQFAQTQGDPKNGKGGGDNGGGGPPTAGGKKPPAAPGGPPKEKPEKLSAGPGGVLARRTFAGLSIAVENPAGTVRMWHGPEGTIGATKMLVDYGYVEGHVGSDDEELDVYLGPDENAAEVYVIHQRKAPDFKAHDEDKIHLGFPSADAAKANFLAHRSDGESAYGGMSAMSLADFNKKLKLRTSTGKIRARAGTGTAVKLRADAKTVAGPKKASRYASALMEKSARQGRMAVRKLLSEINAAVQAAGSPADLKARLKALAKDGGDEAFAAIMAKATIMANLAGRSEVLEDIVK